MKIQAHILKGFCTLVLFLVGCASMQNSASIQGSVTYSERMALSPSAQLEIVLADV
jgi:uncharacterized lipoprotein YbaY